MASSPLVIVFFLTIFSPDFAKKIWEFTDETNIDIIKGQTLFEYVNKELLFVSGIGYLIIFFFSWVFTNRFDLFPKTDWIREISVFLLALSVAIWFYTRIVNVLVFTVMGVLMFYGIKKRQRYKPSVSMVLLFLYVLLQFVGILWNFDVAKTYFWKYPANITNQLMLLAPIVVLSFFRFTSIEKNRFIAILFHFLFFYVILHLTSYLLMVNYLGKNIFSCLAFNKEYLDYLKIFQYSKYHHPSLISYLLLVVGGIGYVTYKKGNYLIKRNELIIYWLMTLFFIFIVQSRVAQIGYFLIWAFILFFEISKRISKQQQLGIILLGGLFFLIGMYVVGNFTPFFYDSERVQLYNGALEIIRENNPFWGAGAYSEMVALEKMNLVEKGKLHFHNDFLQVVAKYGILGLSLLLLWVFVTLRNSLKKKNLELFFFMLPTLLIMMTDSALNHYRILIITAVFLFVFLEKDAITINKKYGGN